MNIGVFDSGIGGLTVAQAIKKSLPQVSIVYFGDTAHLPYGNKPSATIQAYAIRICSILLQEHCKVIVIACNSASTAAYDQIKAYVGKRAQIFDVINPMVHYVQERFQNQTIGLIGTQQTVQSGVYAQKFKVLQQGLQLKALATPLLAPMIEEEFAQGKIRQEVIHNYLRAPQLQGIRALILGCTHYSIIKNQIEAFYQHRIAALDATNLIAVALKDFLGECQLTNRQTPVRDRFIVSKLTTAFEQGVQLLFGRSVHLEQRSI